MIKKLCSDIDKIYRNAVRFLSNKGSTPKHRPCMFVVFSHGYKVYFECLTLVTNRVYVRTRKAVMDVPYSPYGLKVAIQ
ncbi:hypothetical protein BCV72DRAFT_228453 [Rhizopus microsporus var. microsporus]|uniref:Uncharacterized protein n=2 Tax=Rhizopus microsporus TaxID=58291 RepID=A0A2G4T772_RHIZD|nr:uncharacterized protein RHIMIDRAFT_266271 [Rhizopus microsporus ATCC 52813]ORE06349.1 hypothetical protein BCV72DRAFT_228453 [Rhizopus microsporus var. microsporus]PHZ16536.1 hypothetical protein RHIMIDRAFT_266271 [Rhizopus microsporus ATCC 52813]